ncbi:MAG: hypothetical protein IV100_33680 [Myxococcales bacterium]|nr:hypothetical protein [Myxococcales bacterium]
MLSRTSQASGARALTASLVLFGSALPLRATASPVLGPDLDLTATAWGAGSYSVAKDWPDVAAGPDGWLVPYIRSPDGEPRTLVLARLTAQATLVDRSPPIATSNPGLRGPPAVARGDAAWLVVWVIGEGAEARSWATQVSDLGVALTPGGFQLPLPAMGEVDVAWDGGGWTVVANTAQGISAVRVLPSGAMSAVVTQGQYGNGPPAVARGSDSLLLVASAREDGRLELHRLTHAVDGAPVMLSTSTADAQVADSRRVAVAWNGSEYLVAWPDLRAGNWLYDFNGSKAEPDSDLYAMRVSADGAVPDAPPPGEGPAGFLVSAAGNHQDSPSVIATDDGFLVAWRSAQASEQPLYCKASFDGPCDRSDLMMATVVGTAVTPPGGEVRVDSSWRLTRLVAAPGQSGPVLVWSGWEPDYGWWPDTFARRLDATPVVGDATPVTVVSAAPNAQVNVALAVAPAGALAVYSETRGSNGMVEVRYARVGPDGGAVEPDGVLLGTTGPGEPDIGPTAAATFAGTAWVVAWVQVGPPFSIFDSVPGRLLVRRLSADGAALGDFAPTTPSYEGEYTYDFNPALASSGSGALLVYTDGRTLSGPRGKYLLLDASGAPIDGATGTVGTLSFGSAAHAVAWDGAAYLVASAEYGMVLSTRLIAADGAPLGPSKALEAATAGAPVLTAAAAAPWGWLIAWSSAVNWNVDTRVRVARLSPDGELLDVDAGWTPPQTRLVSPWLTAAPGGQPLLTWIDATSAEALAVRFGADGLPTEAPWTLSESSWPTREVVVAATGLESWAVLMSRVATYGEDVAVPGRRAGLRFVGSGGLPPGWEDVGGPEDTADAGSAGDVSTGPGDTSGEPADVGGAEDATEAPADAMDSADGGPIDPSDATSPDADEAPDSGAAGPIDAGDASAPAADAGAPSGASGSDGGCSSASGRALGGPATSAALWLAAVVLCALGPRVRRYERRPPSRQ